MKDNVNQAIYSQAHFLGHDPQRWFGTATLDKPLSSGYQETVELFLKNSKGSITACYVPNLEQKFIHLLSTTDMSEEQRNLVGEIVSVLDDSDSTGITLVAGADDEIVFSRRHNDGLNILSVDPDGDIMIGFSGYNKESWIKFISFEDYNAEEILGSFYSA